MLSQMGDRAGYARATAKLGLTHRALGQVMKARQCLEEAIGILDELGSATVDRLRQRLADLDRAG